MFLSVQKFLTGQKYLIVLLMLASGIWFPGFSQEPDSLETEILEETEISELEFDGLVIDETITKFGRDFYDIFYSKWETPQGVTDYTIIISERLIPRLGTQVFIYINDALIFQQIIQPRYDAIEEMAGHGIQVTLYQLQQYEEAKKNLESEDLSGTGIY